MVQMNLQDKNRDEDIENGCADTGVGMNWEVVIGMYTLPCLKQIASGKLPYSTGSSAQYCVVTPRAGIGVRGTRGEGGLRGWRYMYT